ncbi:MAG: hypothetical protein U0174_15320 [Polyangiaceae bacterium]
MSDSNAASEDRELHPLIGDESDEPSITEVNGTVARFTMAYSQSEGGKSSFFGPPKKQLWASYVFALFAAILTSVVVVGYSSGSNSRLYIWVVEGDAGRPLPSWMLAAIIAISAIGTIIRAQMRGVLVSPDWLESRDLLPFGIPKVERWSWSQIDRFVFDERGVMVELWNNRYVKLAQVLDVKALQACLAHVAAKRFKTVTELRRS